MRRFGNMLAIVLVAISLAGCNTTKQHCKKQSPCGHACVSKCEHSCKCTKKGCQTCASSGTSSNVPLEGGTIERLPAGPPKTESNLDLNAPLPPAPMDLPSPRRPR